MGALMVIGTFTGRRKVLVLVCTFMALYGLLVFLRGDHRARSTLLVGSFGAALFGLMLSFGGDPISSGSTGVFVRRTGTVWDQLNERFQAFGFNAIGSAVSSVGPFGAGIGSAVQGAASISQDFQISSWAAEGGLGKITVELGLPGTIIFALISWQLFKQLWRIIDLLTLAPISYRLLIFGLIAFLASNLPSFLVASQVYGDPFVLIVIGLSGGFVLAAPTVIEGFQHQSWMGQPGAQALECT
jgi:hypothetical protein